MASGDTCNCVSDWLTLSQQLELQDLPKLFEYFSKLQSAVREMKEEKGSMFTNSSQRRLLTRIKVVRVQTGKWNARLEERDLCTMFA